MTVEERIAELRRIELVAGLSDERLRWLAENAEARVHEAGDILWTEGEEATEFFFLLDGRVESLTSIDEEQVSVVEHRQYTFVGAIPLLSGTPYPGSTRILATTRLIAVPAAIFDELIRVEHDVRRAVLATFRPIFTRFGQMRGQREKLAALGEMSAGLAHELNNPASAAGRAAQDLGAALAQVQDGVGRFAVAGVEPGVLAELADTAARARGVAAAAEPLDALERSDREDELATVLGRHGVRDAYDMAADLVEAGLDGSCVDAVAGAVGPKLAADALEWVAAGARAEGLAREVAEATGRIATLVRAVKEYTYMDQAGQLDVDVQRGLETTLTVLGHKLKHGDVQIVRDFQPDLPLVYGYGSELNQVWTNLLDNAIDAVEGKGTITVRARREGDDVLVEIADDGPGVPPELQSRVFEPFFTTKDVGEGTGMGLDVSWRIVVQHHHGDLRLQSRPGETRFIVRLPVQPHDAQATASDAASA